MDNKYYTPSIEEFHVGLSNNKEYTSEEIMNLFFTTLIEISLEYRILKNS